jgi:hypothetical protein
LPSTCRLRTSSLIRRRSSRIFNSSWTAANGCWLSWLKLLPLAIWTSTVIAYTRCFSKGKRFGLTTEDVEKLPLHGAVMKFHKWILEERNKLTAHSANPFEIAKVAAALTPPEKINRRVEGIVIFATSHIVIDDVGVRQEQQDVVLKDAQKLSLESLYKLPPLRTLGEAEDPSEADTAGDDAS